MVRQLCSVGLFDLTRHTNARALRAKQRLEFVPPLFSLSLCVTRRRLYFARYNRLGATAA